MVFEIDTTCNLPAFGEKWMVFTVYFKKKIGNNVSSLGGRKMCYKLKRRIFIDVGVFSKKNIK